MQILRSYWYYWHTGNKLVAVISMILTAATLWLGLVIAAGLSVWGIILAVLLDTVGFWVVVIYAVALRNYLPDLLVDQGDTIIQQQFLLPILAAFLVGRIITFYVAKFFIETAHNPIVKKAATVTVITAVLLAGIGLGMYQHQQNAAAEAARLEAEANAITVEKLKAQVSDTADKAVQATSQAVEDAQKALGEAAAASGDAATQAAEDVKKKLEEACKSTAEALGKSPDDYCK